MKIAALLLAFLAIASPCRAQDFDFAGTRLSGDGTALTLIRANHAESEAPKLEDQDAFDKPAISPGGKYAGWLTLYPNRGASYSQPLQVAVIDGANRLRRFGGAFGMVFGWCFDASGNAVTLMYSFPHGITPIGFDVRRIRDGKLLRRHTVQPGRFNDIEYRMNEITPKWTRCTLAPN